MCAQASLQRKNLVGTNTSIPQKTLEWQIFEIGVHGITSGLTEWLRRRQRWSQSTRWSTSSKRIYILWRTGIVWRWNVWLRKTFIYYIYGKNGKSKEVGPLILVIWYGQRSAKVRLPKHIGIRPQEILSRIEAKICILSMVSFPASLASRRSTCPHDLLLIYRTLPRRF